MDIKQTIMSFFTISEESNKKGTRHWRMQRVSALVVLVMGLYLIFNMARFFHQPYADASAWINNNFNATAMFIFVFASRHSRVNRYG